MLSIERASILKRLSAALLDIIVFLIITVGAGWIVSLIANYDKHMEEFEEVIDYYDEKYDIDISGLSNKYNDLTDEEKEAYNQRLEEANLEFSNDVSGKNKYSLLFYLTLTITSVGILVGVLVSEFVIPLFLKNGQTIGKKVFSICIIKNNGVKASNIQIFARALIGKYIILLMIPVILIIMIMFGFIGLFGTIVILGIHLFNIILVLVTYNHISIPDAFAFTVVVDKASQKIFENEDELIKYKEKLHEEAAKRVDY